MKIKDWKCVKINSVNPLYFIFNQVNGYFEEINGSKCITLVSTNESQKIEKYEELWIKMKDLIRPVTKTSDDYGQKYMKIKFNSDEIPSMTMVVRAIFYENNKYYPQVFLDEYLHKI